MTEAATVVLIFDTLDSTNAEARRRAERGERGPLWILAREQTAGRGRRGRAWSTGPGDLAASLLMVTDRMPADAARVAFVAALATSDLALTYAPPHAVSLKWPNDLLLDGRKASGVLIESGASPGGRLWLAVGIGVNLAHAPEGLAYATAALGDHLRPDAILPTPEAALRVLAAAFAERLALWEHAGFAAIAHAWSVRACHLGARCSVNLGDETIEGVAEALEADGALRLRLDDGRTRRVTAGDVFPMAAAADDRRGEAA